MNLDIIIKKHGQGQESSICVWRRECQSAALQSWSQFISGHRWGTRINYNPNWALIYIRKFVRNKPWAMLTIKPSLLCYSRCATGRGKGMEHPSAIKQELEEETEMSFAREMVKKARWAKGATLRWSSVIWMKMKCHLSLNNTSTVKSTALSRFCLEIKRTQGCVLMRRLCLPSVSKRKATQWLFQQPRSTPEVPSTPGLR